MKIDVSKLGAIFADALYDKLETAIEKMSYVDERGSEVAYIHDAMMAIKDVLGVGDE